MQWNFSEADLMSTVFFVEVLVILARTRKDKYISDHTCNMYLYYFILMNIGMNTHRQEK